MKLYLMRHGPAEDRSPSGQDSDRSLSSSGRSRVRSVAKALLEYNEEPLAIITSQLVRAVQTAEIVAVAVKLAERDGAVEIHREMAPGGEAFELVRSLAQNGRKRVMLVGHEPDLSALVSALLGDFGRSFEKAMVVGIQLTSGGVARLRFVLNPKTLHLDPDARERA
jgi:phosphohistidine phosphatase